MSEDELPFIFAIRKQPRDDAAILVYATWLAAHGHSDRSEYLRLWVLFRDPEDRVTMIEAEIARMHELFKRINRHWVSILEPPRPMTEQEIECLDDAASILNDGRLGYGPCCICGWARNFKGSVTRMPCEACGRVFCGQCADTGVYGSLSDFEIFVTGSCSREGYRLGSDSCLFCQKVDWMKAHGG
jgi:uncharacterized protein (TIGR02996 family)